jgi:uncharacterized membrane protein
MGEGIYNPPAIIVMFALLGISVILLIAGALMRRRGLLRSRALGLIWACLVVAPAIVGVAVYTIGVGAEIG